MLVLLSISKPSFQVSSLHYTSTTSSSFSTNLMHQNINQPQNGHLLFDEYLCHSTPNYFLPYSQSLQFPYMHPFEQVNQSLAYPVCSIPMSQSGTIFCGMPTRQSQSEGKKKGAMMRKIARDRRKHARQRSKISVTKASLILEQARSVGFRIVEDNVQKSAIESRIPSTLYSLDGKRLQKLLTKILKTSDVGCLGRIVIPKKEAEENLPALSNKEGIEVLLKDVCTNHQWSMKYKYWYNNRSRMYVLENTGDFVMHYELQVGDSLTLYEDESKNLYVLPKKEQTLELAEPLSSKEGEQQDNSNNYSSIHMLYSNQAKDEDEKVSFALLIDELSQKEQEFASNLLTMCYAGGSSSRTAQNKESLEVDPNTSSFQGNIDDFFEGLDMSQFGFNDQFANDKA